MISARNKLGLDAESTKNKFSKELKKKIYANVIRRGNNPYILLTFCILVYCKIRRKFLRGHKTWMRKQ